MTDSIKKLVLTPLLGLVLIHTVAGTAAAASGVVSGVLLFYQNQGNFCPFGRDCDGAKYTWLDYQTNEPFANARIYVRRQSDNAVLGQGVTDAAGFFTVAWSDPSVGPFTPVAASIDYLGEHADGRYFFAGPNPMVSPPVPAGNPITPLQAPFIAPPGYEWLNFLVYGTPLTPNPIAQLHDGANKMWSNSLSQSFLMRQRFTGLEIQAFDSSVCPTSCAVGDSNVVVIDSTNSALQPQARVMHELGHIASFLANPNWTLFDATRTVLAVDYSMGGGGWFLSSAEFESAGWEEAVATHYADVGLYYPWADAPFTCLNVSSCPNAASGINIPLEPSPSCVPANSNSIVGNHIQYHWDNYDTGIDFFGEILDADVSDVIDTVNSYAAGTGEAQIDEAWNATRTALDDSNGRSTRDFRNRWLARGVSSTLNFNANCGSAGD